MVAYLRGQQLRRLLLQPSIYGGQRPPPTGAARRDTADSPTGLTHPHADDKTHRTPRRSNSSSRLPKGDPRRRGFDIRIRMDAVRSLAGTRRFDSALDIGCGNGEISVPLVEDGRCRSLTLLDLSQKMLDLARARISDRRRPGRVDFVNQDFLAHDFGAGRFDLIVCLGVMAHIGDPPQR